MLFSVGIEARERKRQRRGSVEKTKGVSANIAPGRRDRSVPQERRTTHSLGKISGRALQRRCVAQRSSALSLARARTLYRANEISWSAFPSGWCLRAAGASACPKTLALASLEIPALTSLFACFWAFFVSLGVAVVGERFLVRVP